MRYTLESGKRINIPDEFIEKNMRALGLTRAEAVELYLSDEGYEVNETVADLTAKAKEAGTTVKNMADKPKRKAPVRKPDEVKRAIIEALFEFVAGSEGVKNAEVTNVERMIAFEFANDKFELTLTKKRKPKE